MLLTVADFDAACARDVPGAGTAGRSSVSTWAAAGPGAAAVALVVERPSARRWPSRRASQAIEAQEKSATGCREEPTERLIDAGLLHVAEGLRVPPVIQRCCWTHVRARHGARPTILFADQISAGGAARPCPGRFKSMPRVTRWSEAIRGYPLRCDGCSWTVLSCRPSPARPLLIASLAVAMVKNDDQGSTRLIKAGPQQ